MTDGLTNDNTTFSEMGVNDIGLGVALHNALGLTSFDLEMPDKMGKLQAIAQFFNQHPDSINTVERVVRANKNPNINNMDHLLSFVALSQEKMSVMDQLDGINNQLRFYE